MVFPNCFTQGEWKILPFCISENKKRGTEIKSTLGKGRWVRPFYWRSSVIYGRAFLNFHKSWKYMFRWTSINIILESLCHRIKDLTTICHGFHLWFTYHSCPLKHKIMYLKIFFCALQELTLSFVKGWYTHSNYIYYDQNNCLFKGRHKLYSLNNNFVKEKKCFVIEDKITSKY